MMGNLIGLAIGLGLAGAILLAEWVDDKETRAEKFVYIAMAAMALGGVFWMALQPE